MLFAPTILKFGFQTAGRSQDPLRGECRDDRQQPTQTDAFELNLLARKLNILTSTDAMRIAVLEGMSEEDSFTARVYMCT